MWNYFEVKNNRRPTFLAVSIQSVVDVYDDDDDDDVFAVVGGDVFVVIVVVVVD